MELTVLTYNIHHGKNTQKQLNLDAIARNIEESKADIIGLNEVDKYFSNRSSFEDQITWLSNNLKMEKAFTPSIHLKTKGEREERQYGKTRPKRRLDYIFASDVFKIKKAEVLSDNPNASDHLAVKAVLEY